MSVSVGVPIEIGGLSPNSERELVALICWNDLYSF